MEQQAGAAQLCLNVNTSTFLPGGHKIQDVRVRTHTFVVPGFPHAAVPLTVPPEAMCRIFDSILAAILVALHLEKKKKSCNTPALNRKYIIQTVYFIISNQVWMVPQSGINCDSKHAIKRSAQNNHFTFRFMVKNLIRNMGFLFVYLVYLSKGSSPQEA